MRLLKRLWLKLTTRRPLTWVVDTGDGDEFVTTLVRWESDSDVRQTHDWVVKMCDDNGWTLISQPPVVAR